MSENKNDREPKVSLYHLLLLQHQDDRQAVTTSINRQVHLRIQAQLDRMITTPPDETDIDIWVESPGGDAHAAYKIVLDLRSRCRYLRAIVPDYAKSAATLLMFGVDKIFMAPAAELGPLDAQIEHPSREGLIVSALDVSDSLESLGRTSMDLAIASGASVVQYTGLPRLDVLKSVLRYMARFLRPAIEKLDPHLIHQATNQLKIAERYAEILLAMRNVEEDAVIDPDAAKELVERLVNEYPTHGFVISRDEARELGLPVENAESYPRWKNVKEAYEELNQKKQSIIKVIPDEKLDELDENTNSPSPGQAEGTANGKTKETTQDETPATHRRARQPSVQSS